MNEHPVGDKKLTDAEQAALKGRLMARVETARTTAERHRHPGTFKDALGGYEAILNGDVREETQTRGKPGARTEKALEDIDVRLKSIENLPAKPSESLHTKIASIENQLRILKRDHKKTLTRFSDQINRLETRLDDAHLLAALYDRVDAYGEGARAQDAYDQGETIPEGVDHQALLENARRRRVELETLRTKQKTNEALLERLEEGQPADQQETATMTVDATDDDLDEPDTIEDDERLPYSARLASLEAAIKREFAKERGGRAPSEQEFNALINQPYEKVGLWQKLRSGFKKSLLPEAVTKYRALEDRYTSLKAEQQDLEDQVNQESSEFETSKIAADKARENSAKEAAHAEELKVFQGMKPSDRKSYNRRNLDHLTREGKVALKEEEQRSEAEAYEDDFVRREVAHRLAQWHVKMQNKGTPIDLRKERGRKQSDEQAMLIEKELLAERKEARAMEGGEEKMFEDGIKVKKSLDEKLEHIKTFISSLDEQSHPLDMAKVIQKALNKSSINWSGSSAEELLTTFKQEATRINALSEKHALGSVIRDRLHARANGILLLLQLAHKSPKERRAYIEELKVDEVDAASF